MPTTIYQKGLTTNLETNKIKAVLEVAKLLEATYRDTTRTTKLRIVYKDTLSDSDKVKQIRYEITKPDGTLGYKVDKEATAKIKEQNDNLLVEKETVYVIDFNKAYNDFTEVKKRKLEEELAITKGEAPEKKAYVSPYTRHTQAPNTLLVKNNNGEYDYDICKLPVNANLNEYADDSVSSKYFVTDLTTGEKTEMSKADLIAKHIIPEKKPSGSFVIDRILHNDLDYAKIESIELV